MKDLLGGLLVWFRSVSLSNGLCGFSQLFLDQEWLSDAEMHLATRSGAPLQLLAYRLSGRPLLLTCCRRRSLRFDFLKKTMVDDEPDLDLSRGSAQTSAVGLLGDFHAAGPHAPIFRLWENGEVRTGQR